MSMKKNQASRPEACRANAAVEGQQDIDNFLRALRSYPDHFAREPRLSFEQHMFSIVRANQEHAVAGHQ
jgi:hypothetical protein